jgi:hypothetical protein
MPDQPTPQRKGETSATHYGLAALQQDEIEIVDTMRRIAGQERPGLLVAYFNGSNWLLYETPKPKWLPKDDSRPT